MGTLEGDRPQGLRYQSQKDARFEGLLSKKEIEAIREQARLKVDVERKDKAHAQLLSEFMEEERRRHDPKQELHPICLELAPSMPWIMLDGTQYLSGPTYKVTQGVYDVLVEQQARGWAHEEITQVRSDSGYTARRPSYVGIHNYLGRRQPRDMQVSGGALAGVVGSMQGMMNP